MEFKAAGWLNGSGEYCDEMQGAICAHVLKLLDVFDGEGHSGSTAPYTINMFARLAKFEPIAPLTGEDWEWNETSRGVLQNKRASHVFRDLDTGETYDIDGKVFWEWAVSYDEDGKENGIHKSYYTCRDSRVPVTFPYVVPDKPIYEYRYSDATPQQPTQDENGFL
jgi:hypothetical protein